MKRAFLWIALLFLTNGPAGAQLGAGDLKLLSLFGDVFERVRQDYADPGKAEPWTLVDAGVQGLLKASGQTSRGAEIQQMRSRIKGAPGPSAYSALNYFGDVFDLVKKKDGPGSDNEPLIHGAIVEMLSTLDPHSSYMTAKEFRDMQVRTRGAFGAPGMEIKKTGERIVVVRPIPGSQAEQAGIACGDTIAAIDGAPVASLRLEEVVERLRGPVNSRVVVSVLVAGRAKPFDLTIERKIVDSSSVEYGVRDDIGYILIRSFPETAKEHLEKAIAAIKAKTPAERLKGYTIDLRGNSGGLLDAIVASTDLFLERGEIVSTRGRGSDIQRYNARSGDLTDGKPIVLMIDGGTASGAEMFAAALRDHKRATIVGRRSHGDSGTIQTIIPLGAGNGALRLTTGRMFSPRGDLIANGLIPDVTIDGVADDKDGCAAQSGETSQDVTYRRAVEVLRLLK